jgi:DNA repair exonuclease SbcCD ATPase subunit
VDDGNKIEFPTNGLSLLQGHNKDTGGSSGSGKSSVLLGIAFALGYCPYPATALTSRGAKNTLKVELVLDTDEGEVRVKRSSSPVQVWLNGVQVKGGAKAAEERLRQIMGVDPEVLGLLTYRGQKKPGLFLSKTDAEKKELLTGLLRLDKFEAAIEVGGARVKELELALAAAQDRLGFVSSRLEESPPARTPDEVLVDLEAAKDRLTKQSAILTRASQLIEKATKTRADQAKAAFDEHGAVLKELILARDSILKPAVEFDDSKATELKAAILGANIRINALTIADSEAAQEIRDQRQKLQKAISYQQQVAGSLSELRNHRKRLEGELAALEENKCPTCERPWDQVETEKNKIRTNLAANTKNIVLAEEAVARVRELEAEFVALPEFQPNPLIGKLKEAKAKAEEQLQVEDHRKLEVVAAAMAEYRQLRAEAEAAVSAAKLAQAQAREAVLAVTPPELTRAVAISREAQLVIENAKMDIALYEQELEQANHTLRQREKIQEQLTTTQKEVDETQAKLNEEKDLLAAIGREGFLGSIFDEVLQEISDETNRILASVANTRHCTFFFRTETITQKGTAKKAIVPVITVDGLEAHLEAGISGGMHSVVELAVDLALGAVVSRREGACPGWLVLDESFGGLGAVEMESALEILQRYAQDRLVIVVEHMEEFKSMFTKVLRVEYQAGKSTFVD